MKMKGTGTVALTFLVVILVQSLITEAVPLHHKHKDNKDHTELEPKAAHKHPHRKHNKDQVEHQLKELKNSNKELAGKQRDSDWVEMWARNRGRDRRAPPHRRASSTTPPPRRCDTERYGDCFLCGKMADDARIFYECCSGELAVTQFCERLLY